MSLPAVSGATIYASDLYPLAQPSGGQEKGKHFVVAPSYASGSTIAQYMQSTSRGSTPVSVSIDTTDLSPVSCGAPSTARLTANGFQITANSTATATAAGYGGNFTIQY